MTRETTRRRRPQHTPTGASRRDYHPDRMTEQQRINRAIAMSNTPTLTILLDACTKRVGRPALLSYALLARILFFHTLTNPATLTIASVARTVAEMSPRARAQLGIPEEWVATSDARTGLDKRILDRLHALSAATRAGVSVDHDHTVWVNADTGEIDPCPTSCPALALTPEQIHSTIVQAGLPTTFPRTPAVAIDGTDVESYYAAYPHDALHPDGRICADREARWAKRTATNRRPTEFYVGFELHLATYIADEGTGNEVPLLCAGMALRPGVTDRIGAALALVDAVMSHGDVTEALFDRGYTMATGEHFARPLRNRGVEVVFDLHSSQRGTRPGPVPGTLWIDGSLYSAAIPTNLRQLEPPRIGQTSGDNARVRELFDAREPFRFTRHSRRNDALGTQRYKGPALAGHVRCPNTPASMRRSQDIPTTTCTPGSACGCGITLTVPDTLHERDRQRLPWQSTAWASSYHRRNRIESLNSKIRVHDANVNHGFIRVRGLNPTALLLAFTLAAYNARELYRWHVAAGINEPWQSYLGEPIDDRPIGYTTRSRTKPRRGPPRTAGNTRHNPTT